MWGISAAAIAACSAKLRCKLDDRKVPLMGVLGAFVFAAQMINFTIPATGSSGHLGGALLLAILLGPCAGFLTIASVLVVQALFFADGGLLALGCNIFNIGFLPAFVVHPLCYRNLVGSNPGRTRLTVAAVLSAIIALQLGPFAVVVETCLSGISQLPFPTFLLLMQPIHLAVGVVEGVVTAAVVSFVREARPEILSPSPDKGAGRWFVKAAFAVLAFAVLTAGALSSFASRNPDGLEWAVSKATGGRDLKAPQHGMHRALAALQGTTALFPDYRARGPAGGQAPFPGQGATPRESAGTGIAGVAGTLLTLLIVFTSTLLLKKRHRAGRDTSAL